MLQRFLTAHSQIASAPETWLLLPVMAMLDRSRISSYSDFSSRVGNAAFTDIISRMEGGEETFYAAVRDFTERIYRSLCMNKEMYFLDKTPRYYLIIDHIHKIFPDAKFIFLFRNPLEVLASIITTWGNGKMRLHMQNVDLYKGPLYIHRFYREFMDMAFPVQYEKLVSNPEDVVEGLCRHLEIDFEEPMLTSFKMVDFGQIVGDQVGTQEYQHVSTTSLEKWKTTLNTPLRQRYCLRYLDRLGSEVLSTFGYDKDSLKQEVSALPIQYRSTFGDLFWLMVSLVGRHFPVKPVLGQMQRLKSDEAPSWLD